MFDGGLASVVFAERTATLGEEALSLEVLFAAGAVEALAVVVVVQGLHPLVTGFDGESAGEALGGEQIIPVLLAVGIALLQEERAVAKLLATVRALEALRMELLADGIQAIALNSAIAFRARWCQELLEAVLAVQVSLLLDETNVGQRTLAVSVVADEVIRTPDASQCGNEWTCDDLVIAPIADRYLILQQSQCISSWGRVLDTTGICGRRLLYGLLLAREQIVIAFHIRATITCMRG